MLCRSRAMLVCALRTPRFCAPPVSTLHFSAANLARKFTDKHEWIEMNGNTGTVGLSKHATDMLGEIVYVELPDVGRKVIQFGECAAVESVKAASDVYAPVSGTISAVNEALNDQPKFINKSPYDMGWLLKIEVADTKELDKLLDADAYEKFVKTLEDDENK